MFALCSFFITTCSAMANSSVGDDKSSCQNLSDKEAVVLLKKLGVTVISVKQAPVKGLYELLVEKDGQKGILFIDCEKKYLMQGVIVGLSTLEPISSHKLDFKQPRQQTSLDVKLIPVEYAMIMGNPKADKKIYVFTDPDCPYCRKAHAEFKRFVKLVPDVAVYVMLFPLPMHPAAYDKSRSVLESQKNSDLDLIFEGKDVAKPVKESSKHAIEAIIKFATANGIMGTPTLVMPDGKIEVGMREAETLKKLVLGLN